MPPSPALRFSPSRDHRTDNHKRGRSLEGGLHLKEKDDDLALFNDMQSREKDNFLLQSTDDLDDSLSTKLRYFSDIKLGISIPVRGESSDLLNGDGEKNDYDWLLTPPDTPLFPSLDDETPPVNHAHRGRPRSQPVSISRTGMTERSYRSSRSSASPHRLSPSPRSGNSTYQSRGRPSSAPHTSPSPVQRPTTPSRRPSTPPNKPSTPTARSSTPTLRRMSTGSSGQSSSSGRRGTSPVKSNRGNSASPKLQTWQSTLPGFSAESPPNLRTSLSDRPASYVRGSSPASRNGRDSFSKFGRQQSMSPTASRSPSSSYSHDRDRFSSQSKGSVASSGDDDMDSLQSLTVGISAARRNGPFPNSRTMGFSKKPSRTLSSSSAPKRSFDSAIRQMEHRKTPQNMFRPLLSSVPTTTFYAGKASTAHRPMISRNSSITTSSNASSELGASVAPENEGCDHEHEDDLNSEWQKASYCDAQEEVFNFDKVDEINEKLDHVYDENSSNKHENGSSTSQVEFRESEKLSCSHSSAAITGDCESSHIVSNAMEVDHKEMIASCSRCGRKFQVLEIIDGKTDVCQDCAEKSGLSRAGTAESALISQSNTVCSEGNSICKELEPETLVPGLPGTIHTEDYPDQSKGNIELGDSVSDSCVGLMEEEGMQHLEDQQFAGNQAVSCSQSDGDSRDQQMQHLSAQPSLEVDTSEGAGISVLLLKRSSSSKWPVLQGRAFAATNIPFDDPLYARDFVNGTRSGSGHHTISASSSVDLSSSWQTECRFQRQVSSRRLGLETSRDDLNAMHPSSRSSFSGISSGAYIRDMESQTSEEKAVALENAEVKDKDSYFVATTLLEEDKVDPNDRVRDGSDLELLGHTECVKVENTSTVELLSGQDCVSSWNVEDFPKIARCLSDVEVSVMNAESPVMEKDALPNTGVCEIDGSDMPGHGTSAMMLGDDHDSTTVSETDDAASPSSKSIVEAVQESSVSATLEKDVLISAVGSDTSDHACEGSTITVEGPKGHKSRNLTLDEATDTILFCSSIIHNLAYEAAAIAIEKEDPVILEGPRPQVTILGKSNSDRKEPRGRTSIKRTPRSSKARQKRLETNIKIPTTKTDNDEKTQDSMPHDRGGPNKVDSLKPPKLENKCNCTVM